jgi:hypothetical protein
LVRTSGDALNTYLVELRSADHARSVLFLTFAAEEALAKDQARRAHPDLRVHSVERRCWEIGVHDTGLGDTGLGDTGLGDTGLRDTGVRDTGFPVAPERADAG